ncbi:unnamed protein product [Gadus morhua 'NCC']
MAARHLRLCCSSPDPSPCDGDDSAPFCDVISPRAPLLDDGQTSVQPHDSSVVVAQVMTWGFYSTGVTTEMMKTRNYDDDNHDAGSIADLRHE